MNDRESYSVLIIDNFHFNSDDDYLVRGFPTLELAKEYARRIVRGSVEHHRKPDQTKEELRQLWHLFGENASVMGDPYRGSDELTYFIDTPATSPDDTNWKAIVKQAGIDQSIPKNKIEIEGKQKTSIDNRNKGNTMTELYASDILRIFSIRKGGFKNFNENDLGHVRAALIDLAVEKRIVIKQRDDDQFIVKVINRELLNDPYLDDIFLMIRDCPKEHTINHWIRRFRETSNLLESRHIRSLDLKNILSLEPQSRTVFRYILAVILLPLFPLAIFLVFLGVFKKYRIKSKKIYKKIKEDFYKIIDIRGEPNLRQIGLIAVLKVSGLYQSYLPKEYRDLLVNKYYELSDFDFHDETVKLILTHS